MRRSTMKRSAWPKARREVAPVPERNREPRLIERSSAAIRSGAVIARVSAPAASIPKESAVRSEAYRRLVAALPCVNCWVIGYSQAAHPPPTGKGIKEDDRECFPLCCARPLVTGCHVEFDQYRLIPGAQMREQAARWGAQTRARITAAGEWPRGLQIPKGDL